MNVSKQNLGNYLARVEAALPKSTGPSNKLEEIHKYWDKLNNKKEEASRNIVSAINALSKACLLLGLLPEDHAMQKMKAKAWELRDLLTDGQVYIKVTCAASEFFSTEKSFRITFEEGEFVDLPETYRRALICDSKFFNRHFSGENKDASTVSFSSIFKEDFLLLLSALYDYDSSLPSINADAKPLNEEQALRLHGLNDYLKMKKLTRSYEYLLNNIIKKFNPEHQDDRELALDILQKCESDNGRRFLSFPPSEIRKNIENFLNKILQGILQQDSLESFKQFLEQTQRGGMEHIELEKATDEHLSLIANSMPKLSSVMLKNCAEITDAGIAFLKDKKIEHLDVNNCPKITEACFDSIKAFPLERLCIHECRSLNSGVFAKIGKLRIPYFATDQRVYIS